MSYRDNDEKAEMGIELQFDKELRGTPGELEVMRDGAGYQLPQGENKYKPAKDGLDVVLTIDRQIQDYVEQALDNTEKEYKPRRVTVVVSDPNTGEILAMANRPQFNPNQYWEIQNYENAAISYMFEPGSTFKIITLAAAIEQGLFNPNETYMSGMYRKLPGPPIKDHNNGRGWGRITFLRGVQESSNVAFVILGYERLKQELLGKYFDRFGIGKKTGIELPGERKGIMRDLNNPLSQRDVAVTTFGQGVAVTAIQQVAAVGAIANGGELLKPRIVKELRDPHTGAVVKRYDREVVRRVVSEKTAKEVRDILETVVTDGTGQAYNLAGYHVAGKTGTAQTYDENGKIAEDRYVVSFIGFAPKDNPRLLVYVVVDDPQTDQPSTVLGRLVVAPIFNSVMEKSLQYLQQKPDVKTTTTVAVPLEEKTMPKLVGMATSIAESRAKQDGFRVTTIGTGTKIAEQYPAPYEKVKRDSQIFLVTDRVTGIKMPDFRGKSLREVMEFASLVHLDVIPSGVGFVRQQSISPGTTLTGKERLQVTLAPGSAP
jgi:penicillin-binding protein 2B